MDPVNFKVYLNEPDKDQEVRRFSVDKDVSTNLLYLQSKLSNLFPVLKRKDNSITWTDEDGDIITIGSDEELIIALTEMKGPLYKLNVNVKSGEKKVNEDETAEAEASQAQTPHPGVVCDGCDKPVVGFRYKCVECPDYDLCSACEAKGNVHPGHNFLRIASPDTMWPKHFFKRLNKMHDRIHRRAHSAAVNKDHDLNEEFDYWFNGGAGGRGRGGHHRPCGMGMGRGGGLFGSMMNGWRGEAGGANRFPGQGVPVGAAKPNANGQGQQQEQPQQQQEKKATTPQQDGGDFLRFLGSVIANTLDPMGVDVQVDVENNKGERETVAKTTKTTTSSGSTTTTTCDEDGVKTFTTTFGDKKGNQEEDEEVIEKGQEPEVATCVEPAMEAEAVEVNGEAAGVAVKETGTKPKVSEDERSKTPESDVNEDGWTLVDQKENKNVAIPITMAKEDKKEQDEIQVPIQVSNQPAKVLMNETAATNGIYPTLNDAEKPKEETQQQQQPAEEDMDPRIAVALQAMLNMGFTNDGGWLTKLLESKDGDIGRVLDTLTPTRPVRN